jgi:hypothetical protein
MALTLLHEYTTTYRVVADIRMLNTHYQTLMSRYKAILKPYQLGNYQYENTVLSYYISTLLLCIKPCRNSMHGNNILLQVHRNHPYRQMELSGMETPHMNNTGNII